MKSIVKLITLSSILFLLFNLTNCTNKQKEYKKISSISPKLDLPQTKTRAIKKKVAAKAYYYRNLASISKGKSDLSLKDIANIKDKKINLVVLYQANAPWAHIFSTGRFEITGDDRLNGLMESYDLEIIQQFVIDDSNEGIVIEAKTQLDNPVEMAREISMVDHVLMVHIKELPELQEEGTANREK